MCLILLALRQHPQYPVVIITNRDEYYERPSEPAHFWPDHPNLLAGRDQKAGGTWLGINKNGHFAAVTNFREGTETSKHLLSRGELATRFLLSNKSPQVYLAELKERQDQFSGFNLILSDGKSFHFFSNRADNIGEMDAGYHGLSNGKLNEDWPKVRRGKLALQDVLESQINTKNLMTILSNQEHALDNELPSTGISKEMERVLSSRFIHSRTYGTRCSTVVTIDQSGQVNFHERSFTPLAQEDALKQFSFKILV
jgi:uncharacterized protein with NRDE domain